MSKAINLALDTTKSDINNPTYKLRQGDGNYQKIRATVTSNGEPFDLTDVNVSFNGTTAANTKVIDLNVVKVDPLNGVIEYTPNKQMGASVGRYKEAYFRFTKDDSTATTASFNVDVITSVDITNEDAKDYVSIVDETVKTLNDTTKEQLDNSSKLINGEVDNLSNRIKQVTDDFNDKTKEQLENYSNLINKFDNLSVGGRNYVLNSSGLNGSATIRPTLSGAKSGSNVTVTYPSDGILMTNSTTNKTNEWFYQVANAWTKLSDTLFNPGGQITFSADVMGTVPQAVLRYGFDGGGFGKEYYKSFDINNTSWTRVSITVTLASTNTGIFLRIQGGINNGYVNGWSGGETLKFRYVKIEKGNIATDWTPAPEDIDSATAKAQTTADNANNSSVKIIGNQTIKDIKTFEQPIVGSVTGEASVADTANYLNSANNQTVNQLTVNGGSVVNRLGSFKNGIYVEGGLNSRDGMDSYGDIRAHSNFVLSGQLKAKSHIQNINVGKLSATIARFGSQVFLSIPTQEWPYGKGTAWTKAYDMAVPAGYRPIGQVNLTMINRFKASYMKLLQDGTMYFSAEDVDNSTSIDISGSWTTNDDFPY